jgi:hypothetical protein
MASQTSKLQVHPAFPLLCAVLTSPCLAWGAAAWIMYFQLNESGVTAEARIIDRRQETGDDEFYYLTYRFRAAGYDTAIYSREQLVSFVTYNRLRPGSAVIVLYLPNNPRVSRLAGRDADRADLILAAVELLVPVMAWLVVAILLMPRFLNRHVARL